MTPIPSLSPAEARDLAASGKAVILDVREPFELAICSLEGALSVPLQAIPRNLEAIPRDRLVICLCHHGRRSLLAAQWLAAQGLQVANLDGGIERWALELDPKMARY